MAGRGLKILLTLVAALFVTTLCYGQINPYTRTLRGPKTIVRSGQFEKVDSAAVARRDSIRISRLADSLRTLPKDSLVVVSDSLRMALPDSLRNAIFNTKEVTSLRDSLAKADKARRRAERREGKEPFISDSMSLRKMSMVSAILPGFGQIYNKQYWKLPILYGTLGTSIGMWAHQQSKYKPLKNQFEALTDQGLKRTEEMNALQREMIKHNTLKQTFMFTTLASYIYFIGDAAVCYATNDVSQVSRATTLATICPGAGQIYNKSYWRVPLVVGGFATTIYCIDWNNRGYQRFKKAYRLRADYDTNPELYPNGSQDEFGGRYASSFLKNLRNSYRRNRDLCIILTAGIYILQIVDAHVDAHLRDYDISDDLSVDITPVIDYSYYPGMGNTATMGMNFCFKF
ncbi:MAG: hypothetical protein IJX65_01360 [Alistipes sp.]|nr:hypothetical protein [Alistipes sp.]